MQSFVYYPTDGRTGPPCLHGAHLLGNDGVPVRGEIEWRDGAVCCQPRTQDPVGISLMWTVPDIGTVHLQTTRLPAREKPYHLHVELARHLLMRISIKREEWGLFDYSGMDEIGKQIDAARSAFVESLQATDQPEKAAKLADQALAIGLNAAEQMSEFHANIFIARRQQSGGFASPFVGFTVPDGLESTKILKSLSGTFDFARIPLVWRSIQPTEQDCQYEPIEATLKACAGCKLSLRGGPLLTFGIRSVPDWMYIWENDFESIYEAAREHVQRTVKKFAKSISSWIVVSGIHADSVFGFSFEQIMELTRMAATVTKQVAPRSQVIVDLSQPWGEYYARNQQTIPPLLYADMAVQSGINFDGFGLQLLFGMDAEGFQLRDPLQVSSMIDKLANLGKPLHVTALGAPSQPHDGTSDPLAMGGLWRSAWSEEKQAEWLAQICEIALSKPYVETVCLQPLIDGGDDVIPDSGLLDQDHQPKPVLKRLADLRQRFLTPDA